MILFCPYPCFAVHEFNETISADARQLKPINIKNGRHYIRKYVSATIVCLFLSHSIEQEHSTGDTYTALILHYINTCNVSTHAEFPVITMAT